MTYPATTLEEAVVLSTVASNQLHDVINGDENTQIQVEDGSYIPSVRKAMKEGFTSPDFGGQYKNLVISVSGTGYQGNITADRLVVESFDFKTNLLRNINVGFNGGISGAGGLDTGTISAGNWYYIHIIYNGTTISSLLSLSATSPSLPNGYTMFATVGVARVPTAMSRFLASKQRDNYCYYTYPDAVVILNNGTSLSIVQVSTSIGRPPIAKSVVIGKYCTGVNPTYYPSGVLVEDQEGASKFEIDDTDYMSIWYKVSSGYSRYSVLGYKI